MSIPLLILHILFEVDGGGLFGSGSGFEEFRSFEVEHAGKEIVGEDDQDLIILGGCVVIDAAFLVDAVFGAFQLLLQIEVILVRFKLGITLHDHH